MAERSVHCSPVPSRVLYNGVSGSYFHPIPAKGFAQVGFRIGTIAFKHKQQEFRCCLTHRWGDNVWADPLGNF